MLAEMYAAPELSHWLAANGKICGILSLIQSIRIESSRYTMWFILEIVTSGCSISLVPQNIHQSLYWHKKSEILKGFLTEDCSKWSPLTKLGQTATTWVKTKTKHRFFFFHFSNLIIPLKPILGTFTIQPHHFSL